MARKGDPEGMSEKADINTHAVRAQTHTQTHTKCCFETLIANYSTFNTISGFPEFKQVKNYLLDFLVGISDQNRQ